jgi:hypothetical protein
VRARNHVGGPPARPEYAFGLTVESDDFAPVPDLGVVANFLDQVARDDQESHVGIFEDVWFCAMDSPFSSPYFRCGTADPDRPDCDRERSITQSGAEKAKTTYHGEHPRGVRDIYRAPVCHSSRLVLSSSRGARRSTNGGVLWRRVGQRVRPSS